MHRHGLGGVRGGARRSIGALGAARARRGRPPSCRRNASRSEARGEARMTTPGLDRTALAVLEATDDCLFAFDRDLCCTFVNAAMRRLVGVGAGTVTGESITSAFAFIPNCARNGRDAVDDRATVVPDVLLTLPRTGRQVTVDARYLPLREGSTVTGGVAILRDMTDRRRTKDMLRESEDRFRTMADCAPVLLWMAGTDGKCNYFNKVWLDFTGKTLEQEVGTGWAEEIHPEDFEGAMETYFDAFSARRPFVMEYRLRRRDGEYRWLLDNGVPRYSPSGEFVGYIGSCIDITERVEAGRRLRASLREKELLLHEVHHRVK